MRQFTQRRAAIIGLFAALLIPVSLFADDAVRPRGKARIGLPKRVPWTTSRMIGSPDPPAPYALQRVFPKLSFTNPVVLTNAPGTGRLFVVELAGKIHSFPNRPDVASTDLLLDLPRHVRDAKQIYGLTFHPKFATNRYCYVCYVMKPELKDGTRVSRFTVSRTDPPRIDPKSEKIVISWKSGGHNGGCLKFGPDGCLYISTGDGAGAFPPDTADTGQNIGDLLSSVLRIDVDRQENGRPYRIPPDNPFVGRPGARGEVWSYGHRNPWKMSFDPKTGDLWVGDVGWELWEMIYRVRKGDNFGWSIIENTQPVHPERNRGPTPIVPPTIAHPHTEARSITGGFVYHGHRLPELRGRYVYGDYVTGKIWGATFDAKRVTKVNELLDSNLQVICFGVDNSQELYVVTYDGTIHRLVKSIAVKANARFPRKLSETGLFASVKDHQVAPGVIPYSIIAEPWMDGATAERFIALPGSSTLGIHKVNNVQKGILRGEWKYPQNAVLMKTIFLEAEPGNPNTRRPRTHPEGTRPPRTHPARRRVETQILHFVGETWNAYNYVWNDDQTDAVFLAGPGKDRAFPRRDPKTKKPFRQTWHHAGRTECLLCHTTRGGSVYGFLPEQLDREQRYGMQVGDQLATLGHIRAIDAIPKGKRPRLVEPSAGLRDKKQLGAAARSYLHVNCATCHRRGGGGTSKFELLSQKIAKDKYLVGARPTQGTFGIAAANVIAPGDRYRSVLLYRMAKLGRGRMPHFGSSVVDRNGLELIGRWIDGMPPDSQSRNVARGELRDLRKLLSFRPRGQSPGDRRLSEILSTTSGALMLAVNLNDQLFTPRQRAKIIALGSKHNDPQIRDLFEPFLPEERRTRRLGTVVNAAALLKSAGDRGRGRVVFFRTTGASCASCHKVGGKGKDIGPDLSQVAKKNTRAQILDSILHPSKKIDEKFRVYLVETKQGKVHTGLLVKRDERQVVLKDPTGKMIRIAADGAEAVVPQQKSLMPELLLRDMTPQEVADLLEFLQSLK
jgi:putative heme-binding domain-containing protein